MNARLWFAAVGASLVILLVACGQSSLPEEVPTPASVAAVLPTSSPTPEPTSAPVPEPTATATPEPTNTPRPEPTSTTEPTATPTEAPTATPTSEPTSTPISQPKATAILTSTATPSPTQTPTPEPTATLTLPTATPRPEPTSTPPPLDTPTPTPTYTATPVPPEPGEVAWTVKFGSWIDAKPVLYDSTIYISSEDYLYAQDSATGANRWRYRAGASVTGTAAVFGDLVLIGDHDGWIHAVGRNSGTQLWRKGKLGAIWGEVSTDGTGVFVADERGAVTAFDFSDGSMIWEFETGGAIYGGATVADGVVYAASYDEWVYALDASSGEALWKAELLLGSNSTPTVSDGLVLIGSWGDRVYALDAMTGQLVWNFWAGDGRTTSVTAAGDSVYFGSADGYIYSVAVSDGSLRWRHQIGKSIESTPAVEGGLVHVGSDDDFSYALDSDTGSLVWRFQTRENVRAPILVHQDLVYVGSDDGNFYALATGFPDDYVVTVDVTTPQSQFNLLSPEELKQRLKEAFGSQQPVFASVAIFGPDGKTIQEIDGSDLVTEIFENGYYLLTGRTVQQDGWEARFFSLDDYAALAEERGYPSLKRALGWCCIRTDDGLALVMRADRPLDSATATTAHEAGHALQQLLNPAQNKGGGNSLMGALHEAEAFAFEVALARKIGDYADIETARLPTGYRWRGYLDQWRESFKESLDDLTKRHDRGRLIMWLAVLHDPELADLREELERDGHLSADSVYRMFLRFTRLTPTEVEPYINSITPERLGDDLNYFSGMVNKRAEYVIDFPDLVLNVPTLAIIP